jgi:hypothetical protein
VIFAPAYYLEANRPFFPPALLPAVALARLEPVAALLPPAANLALECHLHQDAIYVDFIPQFIRPGGSVAVLARGDPDGSGWPAVRDFCASWLRPDSPLARDVHAIWLEFDLGAEPAGPSQPSIFVGFAGAAKRAGYGPLVETAVAALQPGLLSPAFSLKLAACFAALPAGADLFSIGFMLARGYDRARVCIGHLPPGELLPYLHQVGWPGPWAAAADLVANLAPLVDEYGLALDLGDSLSPKLGVECYLFEPSPRRESRWALLFDYLIGTGCCAPAKADALLRWPGRHFHGMTPAEIAELRTNAPSLAPRLQNLLTRRISHVKLVLEPGQAPQAKAYLELSHAWLPFGSMESHAP